MARDRSRSADGHSIGALLFCVFVIIGSGYILYAKIHHAEAFAVTAAPVVIMLVYAAFVKLMPFFRLREDQAGDNLYYMGFLFTLTSLGVSLYQFRADGAAEEIVQNFGVAVGSTIAGVALRVIFNQMRLDPVDVEQSARLELAEAARRVRKELDGTAIELAHFRRSSQQAIMEGFEEVRQGMEAVSTRILNSFEDVTARASKPLDAAATNTSSTLANMARLISEALSSAAQKLAIENDRMSAGAAQLTAALQTAAENLASMQTPEKTIEIRIQPLVAGLSQSVEDFGNRVEMVAMEERSALSRILETFGDQEKLQQTIHELAIATAASAAATDQLGRRFDTQMAVIQSILESLEGLRKGNEQAMPALHALGPRLDALAAVVTQGRASVPLGGV